MCSTASKMTTVPDPPPSPVPTVPLPRTPTRLDSPPWYGLDPTPYAVKADMRKKFPAARRWRRLSDCSPPPFREVTPTPSAPHRPVAPAVLTFTKRATIGIGRDYRRVRRGPVRRDHNRVRHGGWLENYRAMMQSNMVAWDTVDFKRATAGHAISIEPVLVMFVGTAGAATEAPEKDLEDDNDDKGNINDGKGNRHDDKENLYEGRVVIDVTGSDTDTEI
ncbi:hypothetical protein EDC01DRAFT_651525 [Geopyxis carbonaria]|nr:hypothetical protein EDC01DRAFT_651525 [Geopyxis carbonaria]